MYIKTIQINNFRLFETLEINDLNIPDNTNEGSGLTIIVGENGCGKTTILDAISFPMLEYKADTFCISDLNNTKEKSSINLYADKIFDVIGLMPRSTFKAKGFNFNGGFRSRSNSNYLSSAIVYDQLFIAEDKEKNINSNIELRTKINNPYKGKRFNETDMIYLDKNRLSQTKSGIYNQTRFDRIMEDLNYQYNKTHDDIIDINSTLKEKIDITNVKNTYFLNSLNKFETISSLKLRLHFLDNYEPFSKASLGIKKENLQYIPLSKIGSGYEMIFALIYSYYMAEQSKKDMIILIDEPELHLHPSIQQKFVDFLLEASKNHQVIITTHSPLLVKQLFYNENIKTLVLKTNKTISCAQDRKLSYVSSNEINYIAFGLATEEYHNELYEELKDKYGSSVGIKQFDNDYFVNTKGESKIYPWKGHPNEVSIHTFIRNQIHHRKENGIADYNNLKQSIETMRSFL